MPLRQKISPFHGGGNHTVKIESDNGWKKVEGDSEEKKAHLITNQPLTQGSPVSRAQNSSFEPFFPDFVGSVNCRPKSQQQEKKAAVQCNCQSTHEAHLLAAARSSRAFLTSFMIEASLAISFDTYSRRSGAIIVSPNSRCIPVNTAASAL